MKRLFELSAILAIAAQSAVASPFVPAPADMERLSAEFGKYHRQITGRNAPDGVVCFAIDPAVSKSGRDAYEIVSGGGRAGRPRSADTARPEAAPYQSVSITGSNQRSVWYGLYDLLERRGGCHWFWDGDVVPKKDTIDLSGLDVHEEAHFEYRAIRSGNRISGLTPSRR